MVSNGRTSTWRRGHCKSRGKSRKQPLGVPLAQRRAHLPGQRPPQAPRSAEAGGVTPGPVPRPAPHLRDAGAPERRGYQDRLRDAGPLLRRVHPGYLRPRHHPGPAAGGGHHGSGPGGSHLKTGKQRGARARENRARAELLPKSRTKSFDPWRQHAVGVFACGDVAVVFVRSGRGCSIPSSGQRSPWPPRKMSSPASRPPVRPSCARRSSPGARCPSSFPGATWTGAVPGSPPAG